MNGGGDDLGAPGSFAFVLCGNRPPSTLNKIGITLIIPDRQ